MHPSKHISTVRMQFWLLLLIILPLASCDHSKLDMYELPPRYTVFQPENLYLVPVVLMAQVLKDCAPIGKIHPSRWNGNLQQLWQVRVKVEHVLQGDVPLGEVSIYYFVPMGSLGTSDAGLTDLATGDREIFFLQRDNGQLRTICDGGHNCVVKVPTGAHPHYKRSDSPTINDAILDILFTRGEGATDQQVLAALRLNVNFGEQATVKALERLVKTESPEVATQACLFLEHGFNPPHSCPKERNPQ